MYGTMKIQKLKDTCVEVCEELRKRKVDVCGIQEVRWKNKDTRFLGAFQRMYKLWRSENSTDIGGVGILVKEEPSEKVIVVVIFYCLAKTNT